MSATRCVCGWCPTELPDDMVEWWAHTLTVHGYDGYSIRHYPALSIEDEMAGLVSASGVAAPEGDDT